MFCLDICESLTWHVFETPPTKVYVLPISFLYLVRPGLSRHMKPTAIFPHKIFDELIEEMLILVYQILDLKLDAVSTDSGLVR